MRRVLNDQMQHHYLARPFDSWHCTARRLAYERRTCEKCLAAMRQRGLAAAFRGWQVDALLSPKSVVYMEPDSISCPADCGMYGKPQPEEHSQHQCNTQQVGQCEVEMMSTESVDVQETAARKVHGRTVVAAAVVRLRGAALSAAMSGWREAAGTRCRLRGISNQVREAKVEVYRGKTMLMLAMNTLKIVVIKMLSTAIGH